MSSPCATTAAMPWLAPCCADCGRGRGAAGDVAPLPGTSSSSSSSSSAGLGAVLVLGGIFLAVMYGEKVLTKLGG